MCVCVCVYECLSVCVCAFECTSVLRDLVHLDAVAVRVRLHRLRHAVVPQAVAAVATPLELRVRHQRAAAAT